MKTNKINNIEVHIFHGDFCTPCREALPLIKELEIEFKEKYTDNINFIYHQFEHTNNEFDIYYITNIPTIILKYKNKYIERWIGMPLIEELNNKLTYFLTTKDKIKEINIKPE